MGRFNRDNKFGGGRGGRDRGRREFGGGRDLGRPEMHQAVCSDCGETCEIPFRPSGDRPVYCSDCFRNHGDERGGRSERSTGGDRGGRSNFSDKRLFDAVCDKCGNDCQVPFRPTPGKPVFCDQCFTKENSGGNSHRNNDGEKKNDHSKEQFDLLNAKLDKIIKALTVATPVVEKQEPVVTEKTAVKEKVKEVKRTPEAAVKIKTAKKIKAKKSK